MKILKASPSGSASTFFRRDNALSQRDNTILKARVSSDAQLTLRRASITRTVLNSNPEPMLKASFLGAEVSLGWKGAKKQIILVDFGTKLNKYKVGIALAKSSTTATDQIMLLQFLMCLVHSNLVPLQAALSCFWSNLLYTRLSQSLHLKASFNLTALASISQLILHLGAQTQYKKVVQKHTYILISSSASGPGNIINSRLHNPKLG